MKKHIVDRLKRQVGRQLSRSEIETLVREAEMELLCSHRKGRGYCKVEGQYTNMNHHCKEFERDKGRCGNVPERNRRYGARGNSQ